MDPTSLSIVSLTGMVLLGTVLGYKVGVYKGKVDKILPLLEALEEIKENYEEDQAFEKRHADADKETALEVVEQSCGEQESR